MQLNKIFLNFLLFSSLILFAGVNNSQAAINCAGDPQTYRCSTQPENLIKSPPSFIEITGTTPCCRKECVANATFTSSDCECVDNYFADGTICSACPSAYSRSVAGSTSKNACYLVTAAGNYVETAGAGQKVCLSGYYCPGNISIYHSGSGTTTGGRTQCTNAPTNSYYTGTGGTSSNCPWACETGFHQSGNACISNTRPCNSSEVGLNGASGNADWNGTSYDLTTCYKSTTSNTTYGTKTENCYWVIGGAYTNCKDGKLTKCNAGYYAVNITDADCTKTPAGYYSPSPDIIKSLCPKGSTSNAGSTSISSCFMLGGAPLADGAAASGATKFCDLHGCFNLPAGVKIYY